MKRGFTLIELMGVIVVLGVLAAISTIAVDKIIKENKQSVYEAQIASIEDGARAWAAKHINEVPDENGAAISVPLLFLRNEGIISEDFENPKTNKPFNNDLYINISYEGGIYKYEAALSSDVGRVANPELLNRKYYSPIKELCEKVTESTKTTGNVPQGNFAYGDEYTCELGDGKQNTFFVLERNGDLVSLIMNANVGNDGTAITSASTDKGLVAWVTKKDYIDTGGKEDNWNKVCTDCGNNDLGSITAKNALKANTKVWTKIEQYQTTLPMYEQISKASGDKTSGLPIWIYNYLNGTKNAVPNVKGYWMASSDTTNFRNAWYVSYSGNLSTYYVISSDYSGVRPVITLSIS